ncbi:unnamed protein product [Amaranthus hypochondriacus]
MTSLFNIF